MYLTLKKHTLDLSARTHIMGILNITPDSFSDGGRFNALDQALFRAEEMIAQGCDIIDIGGESTRPGHTVITPEEEIHRVAPVIEAVKQRFDIPVSLDTYKYQVAEAGLLAGADMINDIWGLRYDDGQMAQAIARSGAACCIMHNRKDTTQHAIINGIDVPKMNKAAGSVTETEAVEKTEETAKAENTFTYTGNHHLFSEVLSDLQESIKLARQAGISRHSLLIDPGIGFAKSYEDNMQILAHLEIFNQLELPLLLGTSRKSVIGLTLDLPPDQREEGTLVTTVLAVQAGFRVVRVHDVEANSRAIRMTEAILSRR